MCPCHISYTRERERERGWNEKKKVNWRFVSFIMIQFQVSTRNLFRDFERQIPVWGIAASPLFSDKSYGTRLWGKPEKVLCWGKRTNVSEERTNKVCSLHIVKAIVRTKLTWTHPHNSIVSCRLQRCVGSSRSIGPPIAWWSERSARQLRHTSKSAAEPLYSSDLKTQRSTKWHKWRISLHRSSLWHWHCLSATHDSLFTPMANL